MASTYTPLGIELQATGENAGTWGTKTNTNLSIFEQIVGGYTTQDIAGGAQTTALSVSDGATGAVLSHRMIEFTGSITGNQIVTIPLDVQTFYYLRNSTSGAYTVQFKYITGSGDSFTFATTDKGDAVVFATASDGTNPNILTLPAGDVQFNVGVEQREEVLEFWSDAAQNMRLTRSSIQPNNKAGYETDEAYIELSIPVIDESMGLTFGGYGIKELRVDFAKREIDNTFSGEYTVQSENLYWQISDDLALRGGTQNAVRTPDLQSVFGPQAVTFQRANDPCDYRYIDSGIYPTVRRANCEAESWWSEGWQSQIVNRTEQGVSGGNPDLLNELGDTTTIGIIYTPDYDFIPGTLSIALDVVTIDIVDVVQSFSVSQNMAGCYDYVDRPAKFCDTFTRVLTEADRKNGTYNLGDVNSFSFGPNNVGVRNFETHIINVDHSMDTQWGELSTRFRGFHQQIFESAPTGNPDDLEDFTGDYSEPEWLYDITIGLTRDKHAVFYQVDGRSGGYIEKFQNRETQSDKYIGLNGEAILEWDGWWTDAVSYAYTPSDDMTFAVNLTNPFDLDGDEDRFPAEINLRLSQTLSVGFRYSF